MADYMREGGFGMWVMLVTAVGIGVYAFTRPREGRRGVFLAGCVVALLQGLLGLATNLEAVSANFARFPDKVEAIGIGIGEAANAGTFAATLAVLLGIGALASRRPAQR